MTNEEIEYKRVLRRRRARLRRLKRRRRTAVAAAILMLLLIVFGVVLHKTKNRVSLSSVQVPPWVSQDYFEVNPYSRPGKKLKKVKGIVVHYVGNPSTSARQNWNYFNSLAHQTGENKISASSHFIIGLDGEIIQGIPLDEWSYASNQRNKDTISIECCHPDDTGRFTEDTYRSLLRLTAWLCENLKLDEEDVIRHYDVTGKECPKYFVDHENQWINFKKKVKTEINKNN